MSRVCRPRLFLNFIGLLSISSAALSANRLDQDSWERREKTLRLKYTISPGTIKRRRVELNIRRIKNEGGQPVIISHAVVLSNKAMRELGHLLWTRGYDVWMPNTRGHGATDELTKVEPYIQGDYGFDKIVTEDWPKLLQHVYTETGKKVSIIGYSMGGMSWEQTLSGVYQSDGEGNGIFQSDELARMYSKWVNGFAALVVPPDFEKTSETVKQLLSFIDPFIEKPYFIPFTLKSCNFLCFGIKSLVRNAVFGYAASRTYNWLPRGILETSKLDNPRQDFRDFALTRLSSPHTDYIQDFLRWFQTDYESRDSHVSYAWNKKVFVPTLQIVATEDSLAPAEQILEKIKLYPSEAKVEVLTLDGYGHIDISFRQGIQAMSEKLLRFLEKIQEKPTTLL